MSGESGAAFATPPRSTVVVSRDRSGMGDRIEGGLRCHAWIDRRQFPASLGKEQRNSGQPSLSRLDRPPACPELLGKEQRNRGQAFATAPGSTAGMSQVARQGAAESWEGLRRRAWIGRRHVQGPLGKERRNRGPPGHHGRKLLGGLRYGAWID